MKINQVNYTKIAKQINSKVTPLLKEFKKYNDQLDVVMATKMYPNFQSVRAVKFYNTICGHINNNHEMYKSLEAWNNKMVSIKDTIKMLY